MGDDEEDLAQQEQCHHGADIRLHLLCGDGVTGKGVNVKRDEEAVEEMVGEDSVERGNIETEDVINVVKMVKMFCHNISQLVHAFVVSIIPDTIIYLQNMVPYEPDKVGEIRSSSLVCHKLQHPVILHSVETLRARVLTAILTMLSLWLKNLMASV